MKESFEVFDRNKDGNISIKEIQDTFRDMNLPISLEDARVLVSQFDSDKDGILNFEEFTKLMRTYLKMEEMRTLNMFDYFDKNKDGFITCEEFMMSMKTLGIPMSKKQAESIINQYSSGGDKVDYKAFSQIMKKFI